MWRDDPLSFSNFDDTLLAFRLSKFGSPYLTASVRSISLANLYSSQWTDRFLRDAVPYVGIVCGYTVHLTARSDNGQTTDIWRRQK